MIDIFTAAVAAHLGKAAVAASMGNTVPVPPPLRRGNFFRLVAGLVMVFGIVGLLSMAPEQPAQADPALLICE